MEGPLESGALPSTHRQLRQRTAQERPEDRDQRGRVRSGHHQQRERVPNDMPWMIRTTRLGSSCYYGLAVVDDLPPMLRQLVADLEAGGFTIVADESDETDFRNRLVQLANPARETASAVRLVRDRGLWSAEVEVAGRWRDPYQVLLALDGSRYATRASSNEERRRFTMDAVRRIPRASALQPLIERLEAFDREALRRLGVDRTGRE
jgi:hypothetical protein